MPGRRSREMRCVVSMVRSTKRSIAPALVLALGVREEGPLDAVRGARTIVTVDSDADAPAHGRANLAIVASPDELVARLRERVAETER